MVPSAVQHFIIRVKGHQRVMSPNRCLGKAVDDRSDGFGVQGRTQPVLGNRAHDPVVNGHDQFDSAPLCFNDRGGIGFRTDTAAPDQPPPVQHREIVSEPQQWSADHPVTATSAQE